MVGWDKTRVQEYVDQIREQGVSDYMKLIAYPSLFPLIENVYVCNKVRESDH